jgi:flagellar hook-length control protein FliK
MVAAATSPPELPSHTVTTSKTPRASPPADHDTAACAAPPIAIVVNQALLPALPIAAIMPDSAPKHSEAAAPRPSMDAPGATPQSLPPVARAAAPKPAAPDAPSPPAPPPTAGQNQPTDTPVQPLLPLPVGQIAQPLSPPTQPTAPSDTPPLTPAPSVRPAPVAPPVAQIAPALVQIGHAPDGAQRLTLRLDPPELGHVQVRIERPPEAPARVEITVEKPETLQLLLRDQPQLQRALDQAGVPAEGRSVTFHIASPEPAPRSEPPTAPAPSVASGGLSGDGSHGTARQGGHPQRQATDTPHTVDTEFTPTALQGWMRGGLDITA